MGTERNEGYVNAVFERFSEIFMKEKHPKLITSQNVQ